MSAPLTLAQCRAVIDTIDQFGCSRCEDSTYCGVCEFSEYKGLLATIEWLAERFGVSWATCETCRFGPSCESHECDTAEQQVWRWLRGEA